MKRRVMFGTLSFLLASSGFAAPADYKPDLRTSTYEPTKGRDPFGWSGRVKTSNTVVTVSTTSPVTFPFRLEGIMYDSQQPSAIVNNQVMLLNKTVILKSGTGTIEVRAVEITAGRVVLEAGGERVELRLAKTPKAP